MKEVKTSSVGRFEQSLLDIERLLNIQITLHDIGGIFHDIEGAPLLGPWRQSHRRFVVCHDSPREYCLRHCKDDMAWRAAAARAPFSHKCRQGLREIVLPLKTHDGVLLGVLFAGFWRSGRRVPGAGCRHAAALRQLPVWNRQHVGRLCNVLHMLIRGLIVEAGHQFDPQSKPVTRKAVIMQFLKHNASRPVRLADLARVLALSASRTSHLVTALFCMSFQDLLMRERMARAKLLLAYSDLSAKEIAQRVGMPNGYYFNRAFHKFAGLPPGKFRQGQHKRPNVNMRAYLTEAC